MTIIKTPAYLQNYPFQALSPEVVELMTASASTPEGPGVTLKLFEVFCDVTNKKITYDSLSKASFREIAISFLDSLFDESLVGTSENTRYAYRKVFVNILRNMSKVAHDFALPTWASSTVKTNDSCINLNEINLNSTALRYWNGWEIRSRKGKPSHLKIADLWNSHGEEFASQYYEAWKLRFQGHARPITQLINKFTYFLVKNSDRYQPSSFQNPNSISHLFREYLEHYFRNAYAKEQDLYSQQLAWTRFIGEIEVVFIQPGAWATPAIDLPRPIIRPVEGVQTRLTKTDDGTIVHIKLLTDVPLEVTDEEAIEIIFGRITRDIQTVKEWATDLSNEAINRANNRKELAKLGTPLTQKKFNLNTIEDLGLENVCATFEKDGFIPKRKYITSTYGGGTRSRDISEFLGLPTADTLFPFQCLLVIEHPQITESYLTELKLYDDRGVRTGYVDGDTPYLVGFKARRGADLSEIKVNLTEHTKKLVDAIIIITTPLRNYLKSVGDGHWRYLFLTCGPGFAMPTASKPPRWDCKRLKNSYAIRTRVEVPFHRHTKLRGQQLSYFISRITLTTLRASCGVAVYIATGSAYEMALALGHKDCNSKLLSHYLPAAIREFFQSRWIRLFQKALICEALKDSPYLLEATKFDDIKQLDTFLKNHALKNIPSHLEDPEGTENHIDDNAEVYISVSVGTLTALLSIERAVKSSKRNNEISGIATYWSKFSQQVVHEIKRQGDPRFESYLAIAEQHVDIPAMERIIYG